jgi:hypothetical protein
MVGKYSIAWAIVREIFEIFLIVRTIVMQIVGLFLFVWAIVGNAPNISWQLYPSISFAYFTMGEIVTCNFLRFVEVGSPRKDSCRFP